MTQEKDGDSTASSHASCATSADEGGENKAGTLGTVVATETECESEMVVEKYDNAVFAYSVLSRRSRNSCQRLSLSS
jgi:hypothetical protein